MLNAVASRSNYFSLFYDDSKTNKNEIFKRKLTLGGLPSYHQKNAHKYDYFSFSNVKMKWNEEMRAGMRKKTEVHLN
jgi:hypothetical protein